MKKMTNKEYTHQLELALMFMCQCYSEAKDWAWCREIKQKTDRDYCTELWFTFPLIQWTALIWVEKIADLRTKLWNREGGNIKMLDIFDRLHETRKTQYENTIDMHEQIKEYREKQKENK